MKKIIFISIISFFCFCGSALAADLDKSLILDYPIAELGNCTDKAACATYCNKAENMSACISYGENKGLLSSEEAKVSKKVAEKMKAGKMPGGCKDKDTCENFCQNNMNNLDECLSFADEVGISGATIEEGKKIAKALKEGSNLPGGCNGKTECETYCSDTNHLDECLDFGEKSGIIGKDEIAEARKISEFIKSGETPGGCKRKAECDTYCKVEANFDECLSFAEKAGFLSGKDLEMVKKTGGKGPGGCKGEAECATYCEDPAHLDECVDFGVKTGMMSEDEQKKIKGGAKMIKDGLEKIPEEARGDAEVCLNNVFNGNLSDVLSGAVTITKTQGEKVGPCMEEAVNKYVQSQMQKNGAGQGVPEGVQGIPEGIQGPLENIPTGPTGTQGPPSGTQGPPCSSPEECMRMFGPR